MVNLVGDIKIAYLTEHKGIKNKCVQNRICISTNKIEYFLAAQHKYTQHYQLVQALANDIAPHRPSDQAIILSDRGPFHELLVWWLGCKCQCTKCIHYHVHPEQLNSRQWCGPYMAHRFHLLLKKK
jgi:hypothetical protein